MEDEENPKAPQPEEEGDDEARDCWDVYAEHVLQDQKPRYPYHNVLENTLEEEDYDDCHEHEDGSEEERPKITGR